jgi:hypothetical protein
VAEVSIAVGLILIGLSGSVLAATGAGSIRPPRLLVRWLGRGARRAARMALGAGDGASLCGVGFNLASELQEPLVLGDV